jgi:hypothetical protein
MTREEQYIRERDFATSLIAAFFPDAELDDRRLFPPDPDLSIKFANSIVGLETTELNLPGRLREASEQATTNLVRQYAKEIGVPPMFLNIRYHPEADLRKPSRVKAAKLLATFLRDAVADGNFSPELNYTDVPRELSQTINGMHALKFGATWQKDMGTVSAGFVCEDHQVFQEAINKKHAKINGYRTQFPVCYLLLVGSWDCPSSFVGWSPELDSHEFTSCFNRIFFLDASSNRNAELRICHL